MSKVSKVVIVGSFFLIIFGTIIGLLMYFIAPVDNLENERKINFDIPIGTPASKVGQMLKDEGLIKSCEVFKFLNLIFDYGSNIKAGSYILSSSDSMVTNINKLINGQIVSVKVTIPEGMTIKQIADILEKNELCSSEEFERLSNNAPNAVLELFDFELNGKNLEGFLFPDTYLFEKNCGAEKIIKKMVLRFFEVTDEVFQDKAKFNGLSKYELITLASIVEEEAILTEDRPRIAQVFINRLEKNMLLQSCATIQYLLPKHKEKLLNEDLEIESEYNTYKHIGLPPGPICNPGYDSIKACVFPSGEDYLYFVATEAGNHIFSYTYSQHIRAQKML